MTRFGNTCGAFRRSLLGLTMAFLATGAGTAQEFRALWVDAWGAGFRTSSEVTQLINDARAANFNALVVQVRRRGDAFYNNSPYEPKTSDVTVPAGFDPLADLITKAHNTNNGPRLEVHAWIVTYNIWNNQTTQPSQATHPYRLHPDWLTQNTSGAQWDGDNYAFDPGHPEVQRHTFNVCMDIISRYDVDGLNFDYIRYAGNTWGYNPVTVARFNQRFGRTGQPASTDSQWRQFRRDQVTTLVRKVYLSAAALKPPVKISADTITWAPGVTSDASWTNNARAYTDVLQDWRAWMEEGIIDLNLPMAYFDQAGSYVNDWINWNNFTKDRRFNRHAAIGPGIYLNSVSNAILQMRYTRQPSPSGKIADGVCGYSYRVTNKDGVSRAAFLDALTDPSAYDPVSPPMFAQPVAVPVMPWKTSPTRGHVKGFVFIGTNGAGFDAASVTIAGPTNRTLVTDATGFYGAVDLPPGNYTVTATNAGFQARSTNFTVTAGLVATRDLTLPPFAPVVPQNISNVLAVVGASGAIITWTTTNASSSRVEFGLTTNYAFSTPEDISPVTSHAMLLGGLAPGANYFFGVISRNGLNTARSDGWSFATAGDLILDNTEATFSGSWSTGTSATDKYGADYRFITVNGGGATASAVFTPLITTRGYYDVFIWYPQGGNRPTNAAVSVFFNGGSMGTTVNQTANGGGWRQVGTNLHFLPGTNGFVRISNFSADTGKVVMADAVRFVYRAEQDAPAGQTMPDWWAFHYFGANTNALADSDGDGHPNWAEYLAGTVPTNAASRLGFSLAPQAGALRATFAPMTDGRAYQLQQKLDPAGWLTLTNLPAIAGTNEQGWFTVTNAGEAVRVLRLKVDWE